MARVTVGNLLLENLKQPDRALNHYNHYLLSGDRSLAQECLLGKARALNALRRYDEERATLESFIQRFPNSILEYHNAPKIQYITAITIIANILIKFFNLLLVFFY